MADCSSWELADEAPDARACIREAVRDIFGPLCKAAWLSGSFAYEGAKPGRSDIDVIVVLDERLALPADSATLRRIRQFVDVYLSVHAEHGLDPDLDFPGEFLTPAMVEETIVWRGLAHEGQIPATGFPPVESPDYWLDRPDRWYNAWLSEIAFSRFMTGDRDYHGGVKTRAWKTILSFLLLRTWRPSFSLDQVWESLAQFGVKPRYPAFRDVEEGWVRQALDQLAADGLIRPDSDRIEPVRSRLAAWEARVRAAIDRGEEPGPLLLDLERHGEIADYAASRWSRGASAGAEAYAGAAL